MRKRLGLACCLAFIAMLRPRWSHHLVVAHIHYTPLLVIVTGTSGKKASSSDNRAVDEDHSRLQSRFKRLTGSSIPFNHQNFHLACASVFVLLKKAVFTWPLPTLFFTPLSCYPFVLVRMPIGA